MKNYSVNEDGTITNRGYITDGFDYKAWNDKMNAEFEEEED